MSDLTPPKFWKTQGHADYWLGEFIKETTGQLKYHDLFRLPPLVFDKVRVGWETKIILKKRFVDDPDGLIDFLEKYKAGKTDEEWVAARPVMVKNKGPELKEVREGD